MYNSLETIEKQLGIKNGDITRLMYLSTFIGWCDPTNEKHKGYIRIGEKNNPRHANVAEIKKVLKLNSKAFSAFKKRMTEKGMLMQDESGFYLSNHFWNGYAKENNHIKAGLEHTKIHRNAIRNLYENIVSENNPKSANDLSIAMQIIPFINFNTNMLSFDDPFSENPRPLTLAELAGALDMSLNSFKRKLLAINSLEKEYIAVFDTAVRKRIVVNTELLKPVHKGIVRAAASKTVEIAPKSIEYVKNIEKNGEVYYSCVELSELLGYSNPEKEEHIKRHVPEKELFRDSVNMTKKGELYISENGAAILINACTLISQKEKKELIKQVIEEEVIVLTSRNEIEFITGLKNVLHSMGISLIPQFSVGNYRVDAYLPQLNIVIEYDEAFHSSQKSEDKKRQGDIKRALECEFIRVPDDDDVFGNIGKIMIELLKSDTYKNKMIS